MLNTVVINHAHMYCGLGGGAKGMNRGRAQVGNLQAQFECIGGIDVDAAAVREATAKPVLAAKPKTAGKVAVQIAEYLLRNGHLG